MKLSTIFLTLLLGLGIAYSIFKLFKGHGGSGLGDFIDGIGYTSLTIFFAALTILIFNFKRLKKHFDTLLFLLLGLPMTVMAAGGLMQSINYNRTPNLTANYSRPVTEKEFSKDSLTINALAENFHMSRPAVSKHVKILYGAGFISIQDIGRERYCLLKQDGFNELQDWINYFDKFWIAKLNKLQVILNNKSKQK